MQNDRIMSAGIEAPLTLAEKAWAYGTLAASLSIVGALVAFALGYLL